MRVRSLLALILALLMVLPLLAACGGTPADTTTGAPTTTAPVTPGPTPPEGDPALVLKPIGDLSGYRIVYPDAATDAVVTAAMSLRDAIAEATGVTLTVISDRVPVGEAVPTDTREILLGKTNRAESRGAASVRYYDFCVSFENGRLALLASGEEALISATEFAAESLLTADGLCYAEGGYHYAMQYPVADLTLLGKPISEFSIVRDVENAPIAYYLRDRIRSLSGYDLAIRTVEEAERTYEILIGNTGRAATSAPLEGNRFVVDGTDTKVALFGTGQYAASRAVMAFVNTYLTGETASIELARAEVPNDELLLFSSNLPKEPLAAAGKYGVKMTTDAVLARFELSKASLPDEVTVLDCVELSQHPLSERVQVYVSPTGSDENPGTKEAPFATLRKAASVMENRGGGVIWMMEGTYQITDTVVFGSKHSGTALSPLFIKAYEDADVTLTANTGLSTDPELWSYVDPAENVGVYERLPEEVRGEVMYTKLADHGLSSDNFAPISKASGPPRLYVGEEEYTLARYPNDTGDIKDLLYFEYVYDTGTVTSTSCLVYWPWVERATAAGQDPKTWIVGWETRIPTDDERGQEIINWVNTGDIWYFGSTYSGWEFGYYNIALETEGRAWAHNADGSAWSPTSGQTPYLGYPKSGGYYSLKSVQPNSNGAMASGNSPAGHNTYYLFNAVEALDIPGEWFLDRDTDILYVYPTEAMDSSDIAISSKASNDLLQFSKVENLVVDGINVNGANGRGFLLNGCRNVVIQNVTMTKTRASQIEMRDTFDSAVLYSDFSYATAALVTVANTNSARYLQPSGIIIQNNVFHDMYPTYQTGVSFSGYRMVVSHNYFENTNCSGGNSTECIIEYNLFEGGSKDVTDGGMIYTWGWSSRGNHYRYNLIHMFNATHNAIYNDGTGSGHYTYGNTISFLGSKSKHNQGWYSSTGMGNVCIGNVMILRNPYQAAAAGAVDGAEDGNVLPANAGDSLNESGLFYYYFGDQYSGTGDARYYQPVAYDGTVQQTARLYQSEAGHWWEGMKWDEYNHYTQYNEQGWREICPAFMNMMYGTQIILGAYSDPTCDYHPKYFYVPWYLTGKTYTFAGLPEGTVVEIPQYMYLDNTGKRITVAAHEAEFNEDGSITLTYEELAAMERFRRQPAVCVIMDNVLLGGTPTKVDGEFTETTDPAKIVVDGVASYSHYVPTSRVEGNFYEYLYDELLYDAEGYNYDFYPGVLESLRETLGERGYEIISSVDWIDAGVTFDYEYLSERGES